jgi:serine/threonine protein kinase
MLFRGQTLGKYKIIAPLGNGGFGAVYLARDTWIDKDVAVKVPHKQNINFSELLREPRMLAALDHPNIVSITTAEKQENVFFIVMEYIEGHTLDDVITERGGLDHDVALNYALQIGLAVDHAHRHGVIHRDLRPPNVLVADTGVLKVADFGTSRFLEIAAHGTTVIGSPPYMAPEQFDGKAVFASDLYSFGVMMYQMLTGTLPYDAPAPGDLGRLRSGELLSPPRLRKPSIPKALNDIVMKAMAPDLRNRYQRASDLLHDLEVSRPTAATGTLSFQTVGQAVAGRSADGDREARGIQSRLRARVTPEAKFCWHCHKPLHARTDRCPFCSEIQ